MSELLPETWGLEMDASHPCCSENRRQTRRGPVSDILLWVECYSSLVAVLATKFPQHIGDFMAYQKTIIKACKNFEGTAWVIYDRCYRRRAAAMKSLEWATIDSALYNEAFTGRARSIPRCQFCLSDNHTDNDCPDRTQQGPSQSGWGPGKASRWSSTSVRSHGTAVIQLEPGEFLIHHIQHRWRYASCSIRRDAKRCGVSEGISATVVDCHTLKCCVYPRRRSITARGPHDERGERLTKTCRPTFRGVKGYT